MRTFSKVRASLKEGAGVFSIPGNDGTQATELMTRAGLQSGGDVNAGPPLGGGRWIGLATGVSELAARGQPWCAIGLVLAKLIWSRHD